MVDQVVKGRLGSDEPTALAPLRGQAPTGLEQSRSSTDAALLALAKRCETASDPDRELDVAIGLTGKFYIAEPRYPGAEPMIGYVDEDGGLVEPGNGAHDRLVPRYTASLDAAMTLVPDGYDWAVFRTNGGLTIHAWCGSREDVFGETPALALTTAALRARAASVDTHPKDGDALAAPLVSGAVPAEERADAHPGAGQ